MTNITKLKSLKEKIESLEKTEHQEVLKIIKKYECKYTENNNGVFINMNKLTDNVIEEIESFLVFSDENNKMLVKRENILTQ
jgi:hypothetical protein|tara:strand:- start:782 stop:1027 length:246 start_codon:yes stop_codon:yes gene_type:complete